MYILVDIIYKLINIAKLEVIIFGKKYNIFIEEPCNRLIFGSSLFTKV